MRKEKIPAGQNGSGLTDSIHWVTQPHYFGPIWGFKPRAPMKIMMKRTNWCPEELWDVTVETSAQTQFCSPWFIHTFTHLKWTWLKLIMICGVKEITLEI